MAGSGFSSSSNSAPRATRHEDTQPLLNSLAAAGIHIGAIRPVQAHGMENGNVLAAEAIDKAVQCRFGAGGATGLYGGARPKKVLLSRDREQSRRGLFGNAIVRHQSRTPSVWDGVFNPCPTI